METQFDFLKLSDTELEIRVHHLGQHVLLAAEGTNRHEQMTREINHIVFELSSRASEDILDGNG